MSVEQLRLKDNHRWKCKPGYKICVIGRGLVRFDYPASWLVEPEEGAVHLHDRPPSVESCDLGVSIFQIPPECIQELSLDDALKDSMGGRKSYRQSEIHRVERRGLEAVWIEQRYMDEEHNRDARFRVALARGTVVCLISMNYWANRAAGLERVWDEVLRTLTLGTPIADPTMGPEPVN